MPNLINHHSASLAKILYIGDSGSGKTGSLVSLVNAGYKLLIIDFDNGLDILAHMVHNQCPEKAGNIYYRTCTDALKSTDAGQVIPNGQPQAYAKAMNLLTRWKTKDEDLGKTSELGSDWIVVIDSLTLMGDAAFRYAVNLNPNVREPRQWYNTAQNSILNMLQLLYSESFKTNVIITSHITYIDQSENMTKGYPMAIGKAISPKIGRYFNSALLATTKGSGKNTRRYIKTVSEPFIDLKNPDPVNVPSELPLETGLAKYFQLVLNQT